MRSGSATAAVLAMLLAAPAAGAADAVPAAWKRHEVDFTYMGFTTRYSCNGLRDKMRVLLKAAGVRPDFEVRTVACSEVPGRVTPFPRVRMVFYTPEIPKPGAREVGEPVVAAWNAVTLARRQPRELEVGDCELVEQFRDRVLTLLDARAIESDIRCIPHQLSGSSFSLSFELLQAVAPAGR